MDNVFNSTDGMNEASAMFLYPSVSWWCWWWNQEEEEGRRKKRKLMRVSLSRRPPPPPPPSCLQSIPLPSFTSSSSFFFLLFSLPRAHHRAAGWFRICSNRAGGRRATNRPTPPFVSSRQPSRLNSHSQPSAWYRYPMISISRPSRRGQDYLSLLSFSFSDK